MKLTDRIFAPSRSSVQDVYNWAIANGAKRSAFLLDFLNELKRLSDLTGIDFLVMAAQSAHETGDWTSVPAWMTYGNPGGIGIVGAEGGSATNLGLTYENGKDAARAMAVHEFAYAFGRIPRTHPLYQYIELDPRYEAVFEAGWGGVVKTLADYKSGRWALLTKSPIYGQRIVNKGNEMFPGLEQLPGGGPTMPDVIDTSKLVTGRVPHPKCLIRDVYKPDVRSDYGYDAVSPRHNLGMAWHEWQGNMSQADAIEFFGPNGERYRNALVDYVIMPDGTIIRLNNPEGTRAPWASGGGVEQGGLEGDGIAFYNKFGLGAINAKLVSVEIMKTDSANYTPAQIQSAGELAAYWHDRDGQYYFEHPYVTKYGLVTSFLHWEFGTTNCGKGEVDDLTKVQAVTKGVMEKWQTGGGIVVPNPPDVPDLPDMVLPGGISLKMAIDRFGTIRKINAKTGETVSTGGFDPKGVISLGWARRSADEYGTEYDKWPAAGDWLFWQEPVDRDTLDLITFDRSPWLMGRKNVKAGFVWW